ncbi:Sec-independent protein translocase subunit TatA/TatB [Candidatus Methylacidiphilum infernorum]|uniref:Sec-independent protein translocase subunit TatA/TatB n=1 Tax=Candidatus Methylacidiphilum infernorum TaxID=511746 RepID=UPI0009A1F73C|nr:twin-arginine translocase TatA/TatE family subunit [Candidatus Methylacidiphilum infernorum]
MIFAFGLPSGSEWFWIFVVVFLLFGAKKLPELARGLGKALGEFHKAKEEFEKEVREASKVQTEEPVSKGSPFPTPEGTVPRITEKEESSKGGV